MNASNSNAREKANDSKERGKNGNSKKHLSMFFSFLFFNGRHVNDSNGTTEQKEACSFSSQKTGYLGVHVYGVTMD